MTTQKFSKLAVTAISITAVLTTLITLAAISASRNITLNGTMTAVNVEVYSDAACTQTCTAINVGYLNPGGSLTQTIYVKNTGTVPVTLTMATSAWNPANASSYLTLSWNRQSYILNAGLSVNATLTLTAASNTGSLTTFSFNATITGTQ